MQDYICLREVKGHFVEPAYKRGKKGYSTKEEDLEIGWIREAERVTQW